MIGRRTLDKFKATLLSTSKLSLAIVISSSLVVMPIAIPANAHVFSELVKKSGAKEAIKSAAEKFADAMEEVDPESVKELRKKLDDGTFMSELDLGFDLTESAALLEPYPARAGVSGGNQLAALLTNSGDLICAGWVLSFRLKAQKMIIANPHSDKVARKVQALLDYGARITKLCRDQGFIGGQEKEDQAAVKPEPTAEEKEIEAQRKEIERRIKKISEFNRVESQCYIAIEKVYNKYIELASGGKDGKDFTINDFNKDYYRLKDSIPRDLGKLDGMKDSLKRAKQAVADIIPQADIDAARKLVSDNRGRESYLKGDRLKAQRDAEALIRKSQETQLTPEAKIQKVKDLEKQISDLEESIDAKKKKLEELAESLGKILEKMDHTYRTIEILKKACGDNLAEFIPPRLGEHENAKNGPIDKAHRGLIDGAYEKARDSYQTVARRPKSFQTAISETHVCVATKYTFTSGEGVDIFTTSLSGFGPSGVATPQPFDSARLFPGATTVVDVPDSEGGKEDVVVEIDPGQGPATSVPPSEPTPPPSEPTPPADPPKEPVPPAKKPDEPTLASGTPAEPTPPEETPSDNQGPVAKAEPTPSGTPAIPDAASVPPKENVPTEDEPTPNKLTADAPPQPGNDAPPAPPEPVEPESPQTVERTPENTSPPVEPTPTADYGIVKGTRQVVELALNGGAAGQGQSIEGAQFKVLQPIPPTPDGEAELLTAAFDLPEDIFEDPEFFSGDVVSAISDDNGQVQVELASLAIEKTAEDGLKTPILGLERNPFNDAFDASLISSDFLLNVVLPAWAELGIIPSSDDLPELAQLDYDLDPSPLDGLQIPPGFGEDDGSDKVTEQLPVDQIQAPPGFGDEQIFTDEDVAEMGDEEMDGTGGRIAPYVGDEPYDSALDQRQQEGLVDLLQTQDSLLDQLQEGLKPEVEADLSSGTPGLSIVDNQDERDVRNQYVQDGFDNYFRDLLILASPELLQIFEAIRAGKLPAKGGPKAKNDYLKTKPIEVSGNSADGQTIKPKLQADLPTSGKQPPMVVGFSDLQSFGEFWGLENGLMPTGGFDPKDMPDKIQSLGAPSRTYQIGEKVVAVFENYQEAITEYSGYFATNQHVAFVEEDPCRNKEEATDPHFEGAGLWDQDFDNQWAIKQAGFSGEEGDAWSLAGNELEPVIVAVIDSGIDWFHPDFSRSNLWRNEDEIAGNGIDDDGNGYIDDTIGWNFIDQDRKPWDYDGHGTFVAGVIAAAQNNGKGIAGINSAAKIMPIKALDAFGNGHASMVAEAITYAVDNGARIINLSLGGRKFTQIEQWAIDYAAENDVMVVAAAGNQGSSVADYSPAGLNGVITVSATDRDNDFARFSNWGPAVDIAAPGVDVLSLRARNTDLLADIPDVEYDRGKAIVGDDRAYIRASGTSFAAPIVAATASLILSKNPDLTVEQVTRMLLNSSVDIDRVGIDNFTGYGMLDAKAALEADPEYYIDARISGAKLVQVQDQQAIQILGTADANDFKFGQISIGQGENPEKWATVKTKITEPQIDGSLILLPARVFGSSPKWTVRLIVEDEAGNKRQAQFALNFG